MKNKNIKRINTLGKAGKILSVITLVICLFGLFSCVMAYIASGSVPDDALSSSITGGGTISVNDSDGSISVGRVENNGVVIRKNAFENIDIDRSFGGMDVKIKSVINEEKSTDTIEVYDVDLNINGNGGKPLSEFIKLICVMAGAVTACMSLAVAFAVRLCKSLEKCDSPFEENVIRKMKEFTLSLLPWGIASVIIGGVSATGIAFVIVIVILVFSIFRYGAELQRESDETL